MLREELDRIDSVPMLPELAIQILKMVDDPQVTSHRLATVVSRDQSLVTSILRIVNSAYYGFHWRIASVSQAVVLLGFRTIRNLVLAASVMKDYGGRSRVSGFDRMAHWRHSIACGSAAALLARRWKLAGADEAFLSGLVHDIGRVIMDQHFPEEFEESLRRLKPGGPTLTAVEDEVFGLTHAAVGAHVARKWKLPETVVSSIADHHGPAAGREWSLHAALVHAADVMARREGIAVGQWSVDLDPAAMAVLGHEASEMEGLGELFREEYDRSNIFEVLIS
jgi:putative nucleotidyltransferase with HDIG domain